MTGKHTPIREIAPGLTLMRRKLFEAPVGHESAFKDMRHAIKTAKVLGIRHFEIDITDGTDEEAPAISGRYITFNLFGGGPVEGDEWKQEKAEDDDEKKRKKPQAKVIVWAVAAVDSRLANPGAALPSPEK